MPFTFSHPAIILPFVFLPKRFYSMTGLVIGSLTPDFEYFIRMKIQSNYSHTIAGAFWFDIPLGILLCFIFHNIVRDSMFKNLPKVLSTRFSQFSKFDWNSYFRKNWFVVLSSILVGALSHIFWDSFTHEKGYFVSALPVLSETISLIGNQVPILKFLQHSSTILGGFALAIAIVKIKPENIIVVPINLKYWAILSILTIISCAIKLFWGINLILIGNVIVTFISASLFSLILTSWLFKKNISGL